MSPLRIRTVVSSTHMDLPELAPLLGHRVQVIVQDEGIADWPPGWFEATAGSIVDPTFERPAQPEIDAPASLDE